MNVSVAYVNHHRDATNDSYLGDYMETHHDSVPDVRELRPYLADENSITSTLSYGKKFKKHSLMIGLQSFYDKLNESGMYVIVDPKSTFYGFSYRSTASKYARELGLFFQDEWALNDKLMFVPGIRLDNHHSGEEYSTNRQVSDLQSFPKTEFDETSINPRIAAKYKFSDKFTLRANMGTGFRAPYGFSEDLHLCSGSPRVWKSSQLKAETSLSYNLSGDYYGKSIKVSLNLFRTDLKDKIGFTDADPAVSALGYDYQWRNIDDATVQGIEVSLMANLHRSLAMGIDLTCNHGKYKNARIDWMGTDYEADSRNISRFPSTTANLKIEYNPESWSFSVSGNFQGRMYIDYYNSDVDPILGDQSKIKETDPFILVNARVSKTIKDFKLYAGVNNLLNYIQDERHLDDAAFMYAPVYGTMFYGGISIDIHH